MGIEAHITLQWSSETAIEALHARGLALSRIELGDRAQSMLTLDLPEDLAIARARIDRLGRELATIGVTVTRTKLEAALHAPYEARYLEQHIKVRVDGQHLPQLGTLAREHGGHLSRNAHTRLASGREERFITQRFAPTSERADEALNGLLAALKRGPYALVSVERERVIEDDNLALDAGWAGLLP